jgi:hypothetical protein
VNHLIFLQRSQCTLICSRLALSCPAQTLTHLALLQPPQSIQFKTQTAVLERQKRPWVSHSLRQRKTAIASAQALLLIWRLNFPGFQLIEQLYINGDTALPSARIEEILLSKALEAYDSASNGNKTRGGIKKANDM